MIKIFKGAVFMLMLLSLTACVSTSDITVKSEKSEKADLNGYKTYMILASSGIDKKYKDEKAEKGLNATVEINRMIDSELAKKGKVPVRKNPDFFVAYAAGIDRNAIKEKLDSKGKVTMHNIPEAAILLILLDAKTGSILWRSSAEGDMKDMPIEEKRERINFAIKKMLHNI